MIVDIGDDHPADLAVLARGSIIAQHLDDQGFGHEVIETTVGTLKRDVAGFLAGIGVGDLDPETLACPLAQRVADHFADGADRLQVLQLAARFDFVEHRAERVGIDHQVAGAERGHAVVQFTAGQLRGHSQGGARGEQPAHRHAPVGKLLDPDVWRADRCQRHREVGSPPHVIAQHHRQPDELVDARSADAKELAGRTRRDVLADRLVPRRHRLAINALLLLEPAPLDRLQSPRQWLAIRCLVSARGLNRECRTSSAALGDQKRISLGHRIIARRNEARIVEPCGDYIQQVPPIEETEDRSELR